MKILHRTFGASTLLICTLGFAQETNPRNSIDFFNNYIEATGSTVGGVGIADPKSPQAYTVASNGARQEAIRQLSETINGVQVDSVTIVEMSQVVKDRV